MITWIAGSELLDFADDVLRATAPRPAAFRRAVSAAYYAVFHELVRAAGAPVAGRRPGTRP